MLILKNMRSAASVKEATGTSRRSARFRLQDLSRCGQGLFHRGCWRRTATGKKPAPGEHRVGHPTLGEIGLVNVEWSRVVGQRVAQHDLDLLGHDVGAEPVAGSSGVIQAVVAGWSHRSRYPRWRARCRSSCTPRPPRWVSRRYKRCSAGAEARHWPSQLGAAGLPRGVQTQPLDPIRNQRGDKVGTVVGLLGQNLGARMLAGNRGCPASRRS